MTSLILLHTPYPMIFSPSAIDLSFVNRNPYGIAFPIIFYISCTGQSTLTCTFSAILSSFHDSLTRQGKINNSGIAAVSYVQTLRPGIKVGFGASVDTQRLQESAHKIGLSLEASG